MRVGILAGPTGTGKSQLAKDLVKQNPDIELVNADSVSVYQMATIGSAKPSGTHLTDIVHPDQEFSTGDFIRRTEETLEEIQERGKSALIVGGTGFYIKALLYGLWGVPGEVPELRKELGKKKNEELLQILSEKDPRHGIHPNDRYRLIRSIEIISHTGKPLSDVQKEHQERKSKLAQNTEMRLWVIDYPKHHLENRIRERVSKMIGDGLVDEVEQIQSRHPRSKILGAVGYRQVVRYLRNEAPRGRRVRPGLDGLKEEICLAHRKLVKKQRTWFRGEPRAEWRLMNRDRPQLKREMESYFAQ